MNVVEHIEKFLGIIQEGWAPEWGEGVQIVRFNNQPQDGISSFASIGLSNHILKMNEKDVRQEILFSAYDRFDSNKISMCLALLAKEILASHKAILRGEIINSKKPILQGKEFQGFYSAPPVFFEEEFAIYKLSSPFTILVWLIPLYAEEIAFVEAEGWDKFENLLEDEDCDFWDLERKKMSFV